MLDRSACSPSHEWATFDPSTSTSEPGVCVPRVVGPPGSRGVTLGSPRILLLGAQLGLNLLGEVEVPLNLRRRLLNERLDVGVLGGAERRLRLLKHCLVRG